MNTRLHHEIWTEDKAKQSKAKKKKKYKNVLTLTQNHNDVRTY